MKYQDQTERCEERRWPVGAFYLELANVFLTNKELRPEEIIQKVKENFNANYNFDVM